MKAPGLFGSAVILALLTTSGSTQTPPGAPPKGKPAGRATTSLPDRLCDAVQGLPAKRKSACCGAAPVSLADACAKELRASLARGAVTIDAAAVDRCAAETAQQLEGCSWVTPLLPKPPQSCRNLIQGQLAAGRTCRSSLECRDGLFCRGTAPGKAGTCAAPVAVRARCDTPSDTLLTFTRNEGDPRHASCAGLCVKGQCLALAPAGGACTSSAFCQPGFSCIAGRCQDQPLPAIGESCAGNTSCGAGAYCQAGRCSAVKNAGEACVLPTECRALACQTAPGEKSGTCGEPCGAQGRLGGAAPPR
jgi:hypothetical protein